MIEENVLYYYNCLYNVHSKNIGGVLSEYRYWYSFGVTSQVQREALHKYCI